MNSRGTTLRMLLDPTRRRSSIAAGSHVCRLHSQGDLSAILQRERMRADRSGGVFSLLLLWPQARGARLQDDLNTIAEIVAGRLRATDELGHWDHDALGAVLPDTPPAGAWKLAGDIHRILGQRSVGVQCSVYVYPSQQPGDDQAAGQRSGRSGRGSGGPAGGPEGDGRSAPAKPLEPLLAQSLPAWKRALDVFGALVGLVLLWPLLAVVAVAIKLSSPGPVFFRQRRDGLGGRPFVMYKFRTMYLGADARKAELLPLSEQDGPAFKLTDDPRTTPLGRFLRRSCIDELPQLWHVLRGEMSLVGPRPMDIEESKHCLSWQRRRLEVTPGLTCTWQVHGGRHVRFTEWMRMDIRYAAARSLWQDLRLIIHTIAAVLFRRGSV